MGFFTPGNKWIENPYAIPGAENMEAWGRQVGLGKAGKSAKGIIKQMSSGNYGGLAGTILSPIHDQYAAQLREAMRANTMGGNAFVQGSQPALMANIEQETRRKMAEGEGLAYGQAIPNLYGQATGTLQNAINSKNQTQLSAYEAALRARMGAGHHQQTPSTLGTIGNAVNTIGGIFAAI